MISKERLAVIIKLNLLAAALSIPRPSSHRRLVAPAEGVTKQPLINSITGKTLNFQRKNVAPSFLSANALLATRSTMGVIRMMRETQ